MNELLMTALRQYMHNDGSGLVAAYDRKITESLVLGLQSQARNYEEQADFYRDHRDGLADELSGIKNKLKFESNNNPADNKNVLIVATDGVDRYMTQGFYCSSEDAYYDFQGEIIDGFMAWRALPDITW